MTMVNSHTFLIGMVDSDLITNDYAIPSFLDSDPNNPEPRIADQVISGFSCTVGCFFSYDLGQDEYD